jgi:hypothetical protein
MRCPFSKRLVAAACQRRALLALVVERGDSKRKVFSASERTIPTVTGLGSGSQSRQTVRYPRIATAVAIELDPNPQVCCWVSATSSPELASTNAQMVQV